MYGSIHSGPPDDTAMSLQCMGVVYFHTKEYNKSREMYEQALQMYKQVYKNGHAEIDRCERRLMEIKEKIKTEL